MTEETLNQAHSIMEEKKEAQGFYKHLYVRLVDFEPSAIFTTEEVRQFIANEYNTFTKG